MRRLVIDARLAGHSGIGVYLEHLLPRVVPQLAQWRPLILARSSMQHAIADSLPSDVEVDIWDVPPLSVRCLVSVPPRATSVDLLWVPHFNVPLRSTMQLAVTLHDLLPLTEPTLAGRGRAVPVRWWLRSIRARARAVMCVSAFTRGEAVRFGACTQDAASVTPLGVDPMWFSVPRVDRDEDGQPPTIIYVGLLKPHKNVTRLLRAFERICAAIPHRLVLVAHHARVRNVDHKALALMARLADRVELIDDLPQDDLVARVKAAQFAVLPSLHEGFGLPALEAMAAGTPVLAGRAGALPEVCADAALYCNPRSEADIAQGLLRLAGDSALRAQLATAGRARAATFSWDGCAALTTVALTRALAEHPGVSS
ncbi:MAG: glycosyltransferase family 1 protein [Betaproteobacteria bacterium]